MQLAAPPDLRSGGNGTLFARTTCSERAVTRQSRRIDTFGPDADAVQFGLDADAPAA